jgi:hypothetical protein
MGNLNSASCMEHLLLHCANAIEANDATLTHHIHGCSTTSCRQTVTPTNA